MHNVLPTCDFMVYLFMSNSNTVHYVLYIMDLWQPKWHKRYSDKNAWNVEVYGFFFLVKCPFLFLFLVDDELRPSCRPVNVCSFFHSMLISAQ